MPASKPTPSTAWRWLRHRALPAAVTLQDHSVVRAVARGLAVLVVALVGAVGGLLVGGQVHQDVGPFRAEFRVQPSFTGQTEVVIPPLGSLILDSHDAPVTLSVRLAELDPKRTQQLLADPDAVNRASRTAVTDVESGLRRLVITATGSALLGAIVLSVLVFRRDVRRTAGVAVVTIGMLAGTAGLTYLTFNPRSIEEPRYEGLLVNAPAVVGDARRIADRYSEYRQELQRLVLNVSKLYTTVSTLPVYEPNQDSIRVLHVSDLHLNPSAFDLIATVSKQFNVDVVVDTGDITDWGSEREGRLYASGVGKVDAPYIFVRGNHDSMEIQKAVDEQPNAIVLDNDIGTVAGLTFAGIGDPRFTPDKTRSDPYTDAALRLHGRKLLDTIKSHHRQVDVAMVHDLNSALPMDGTVPILLAGHTHQRSVRKLPGGSLLMVEGSTGGAGLRGLEQKQPQPLELSVLYFDRTSRTLQAYDDIRVGGAGRAAVTLERHVLKTAPAIDPSGSLSPSPSG